MRGYQRLAWPDDGESALTRDRSHSHRWRGRSLLGLGYRAKALTVLDHVILALVEMVKMVEMMKYSDLMNS